MHFLSLFATASALPALGIFLSDPANDEFYQDPGNLNDFDVGETYKWRPLLPNLELALTFAHVEQLAYRTNDTQGNASHSVATVYSPLFPSWNPKVVSYQVSEDSLNTDCSPSYSLARGLISPNAYSVSTDAAASIAFALSQGWYVVIPDHEGARSGYMTGREQGQAGLDGLRAGISYIQVDQNTPVALLGYGGGAAATAWMAHLHDSYAPEINIVGAAYGGLHVDFLDTMNHVDNCENGYSGIFAAMVGGLFNSYPDLEDSVWSHLFSPFQYAISTMSEAGFCLTSLVNKFQHQQFHTMADVDLATFEPFAEVVSGESLLRNSTSGINTPTFPRYIWHAVGDQIFPYSSVSNYVQEQCLDGANIQFVAWKGNDHFSVQYLGLPDALRFVKQALEGDTPQVTCGTHPTGILALGSLLIRGILGDVVADVLSVINTITTPLGPIILDLTSGYQY